jgi:AAA15 family ATPase/GTPase
MLIRFSFSNFCSINSEQEFSMVAAPIKEKFETCNENIVSINDDFDLLKSAVIYGANGSGKSNFLKAFQFFKDFIQIPPLIVPSGKINIVPFLLNTNTQKQNSAFEISFFYKGNLYRYGYELNSTVIVEEWLYIKEKRETQIFYRTGDVIDINQQYPILNELYTKKMIRSNALLLTLAVQFNDETANNIFEWLNKMNVLSGINDFLYSNFTIEKLTNPEDFNQIINLLQVADMGIFDLKVTEQDGEQVTFNIKPNNPALELQRQKSKVKHLQSVKQVLNDDGTLVNYIEMPFEQIESEGTKKFFHLLGPVLDTLQNGGLLIVDELDTKLHPLLTERIVKLFNSNSTNPKNAQLIFATHDTNLLNAKIFRRDQIWFAEKDKLGATQLYSLTDYKPRNDEQLEKNYISGKYGAIPFLGDFDELFEQLTKTITNEKG